MTDAQHYRRAPQPDEQVEWLPLTAVHASPYQPRRQFDPAALANLTASIKRAGVVQPIIVRQPLAGVANYELIAGERRLRAAGAAGLTRIPAIVRVMDDATMMEVAVLENLQREDLTPLEEATAYQSLMDQLQLTQAELASRLGKSRPYIANYLRLLGLPPAVKKLLAAGQLSMGQARTLLGEPDPRRLVALAHRAVQEGLTVRQLERIVKRGTGKHRRARPATSPYLREAERQLQGQLGARVQVKENQRGGRIEIPYGSSAELNRLLAQLGVHFD